MDRNHPLDSQNGFGREPAPWLRVSPEPAPDYRIGLAPAYRWRMLRGGLSIWIAMHPFECIIAVLWMFALAGFLLAAHAVSVRVPEAFHALQAATMHAAALIKELAQ